MSEPTPETYPDTMPGSKTAEPSELHQNAVEQEYHTAGGTRTLGEEKPEAYKYAKGTPPDNTP